MSNIAKTILEKVCQPISETAADKDVEVLIDSALRPIKEALEQVTARESLCRVPDCQIPSCVKIREALELLK